jgi:hypothetical protein
MTPEEREKVNALCNRIKEEQDPETFSALVAKLSELLDALSLPNAKNKEEQREGMISGGFPSQRRD